MTRVELGWSINVTRVESGWSINVKGWSKGGIFYCSLCIIVILHEFFQILLSRQMAEKVFTEELDKKLLNISETTNVVCICMCIYAAV